MKPTILDQIDVIAAVNRDDILERDLMASPMIASGAVTPFIYRGARCIGEAYLAGIAATTRDYMIFAHQDVYFPEGWHERLNAAIHQIAAMDPAWAVLGLFGVTTEARRAGHLWSSGLGAELKGPMPMPARAGSLDELVLVLRREAGLHFDPALPHFHLYGTDIVQIAAQASRSAYVIDAPVIHNSDQLVRLDRGYIQAYDYMCEKWQESLPLRTLTGLISTDRQRMRRNSRQAFKRYLIARFLTRSGPRKGVADPAALARRLGYAKPAAIEPRAEVQAIKR